MNALATARPALHETSGSKNSLSVQLHAGFAVAALMVLAVTVSAWWVTTSFERTVTEVRTDVTQAAAMAEAESALWQLSYGFPQFMLGDAAARKRIVVDEARRYGLIESRLDAYASLEGSGCERDALNELRADYLRYKEARPKFFALYQEGRINEAVAWRAQTTTPYGAATARAFDRHIALVRPSVAENFEQAAAAASRARRVVAAVSAFLRALLGLVCAMALRALRPIRALHERALTVMRDTLGRDAGTGTQGNEVQALVHSFSLMSEAFTSRTLELENTLMLNCAASKKIWSNWWPCARRRSSRASTSPTTSPS